MVNASVRLVAPSRGTIVLRYDALNYLRMPGASGWGLAPVVNQFFEGAGDGAQLRGQRRTIRSLRLPMGVFGSSPQQIENRLRAWARVVREPFRIVVDYPNGDQFSIPAVYDSGGSGAYTDSPTDWAEMPVTFKCEDPFWTSTALREFVVEQAPPSPGLLPWLSLMTVSPSGAFGQGELTNPGDVESPAQWIITGPAESVSIDIAGIGFTLGAIAAGEVIRIRKENRHWSVVDQNGTNRYGLTNTTAVFPYVPAGTSSITIDVVGATSETKVVCLYPERREIVYR
ncbi:hypothetical protein [Microcella alkaliphila]|uniref:Minor tail protein n=1 Tax=Microcella alkaliphila TaxID=279828 RepID=A0A0U5B9G2_9MICO|nr:hypothetical protein [Microcella alkaliphila]BAU32452.1 uncharacterized protein MalAC0309_1601 [Microcella alkaliphila]